MTVTIQKVVPGEIYICPTIRLRDATTELTDEQFAAYEQGLEALARLGAISIEREEKPIIASQEVHAAVGIVKSTPAKKPRKRRTTKKPARSKESS